MENATKKIELLDKFIANEKKSRLWTTINITIFCLLGLSIIFLAYELKKSNAKLADALEQLYSNNGALKQDSISLTNKVGNYDSLKNVLDTVVMLFKNQSLPVSANIKNIVAVEARPKPRDTVYTVFVQCMPDFKNLMPAMLKSLRDMKYKVPKWEVVNGINFNPTVKYFNDEDQAEAEKIAEFINKSDNFFHRNPAQPQKLNLKSPLHQIEIWVGQHQQKDIHELIQQATIEQKKGN